MTGRRPAAIGLLLGGVVVALGSFATWDICPDTSCGGEGGLMVLVDRSGVEVGPGIVTLGLAAAMALAGLDALRRGWSPVWVLTVAMAVAALGVVTIFVARTYLFAGYRMYGPGTGVGLVIVGAVAAAISGFRLRQSTQSEGKSA